jgi:ABC-type nitrate/sulfonate/bicarbonate transport system permease component
VITVADQHVIDSEDLAAPVAKPPSELSTARARPGLLNRVVRRLPWLGVLGIVLAIGIWQVVGVALNQPITLATPSAVAADLGHWTASGDIWLALRTSAEEFALGFLIAFCAGIALGVLIGVNRIVAQMLYPLVQALNSTPIIALAPLLVIWFGFGLESKVILIALIAFFPILANTEAGVRSLSESYIDVGMSFGAGPIQMVRMFRLPAAVPFLLAGTRVAVARGVTGIFVGELYGSTVGIGYTISSAGNTFDTARLFSAIVVLAAFGVIASSLLGWLMRKVAPWAATP